MPLWYVVDGMDGSGKTTAAQELSGILSERGRKVMVFDHPTRNSLSGRLAVGFLQKKGKVPAALAAVFFMINIFQSLFKMKRSKDVDDFVFVRFTLSAAYLPERMVYPMYRLLTALLPKPDVRIYKDVDEGDALGRIEGRGEEPEMFETPEMLTKTRKRMMSLADGWYVIDGGLGEDETREALSSLVSSFLSSDTPV
jgi:dTMP kinase